jgi:hypothetical protein
MLEKLAVAIGYAKAPRATFITRHPKAGLTALAVSRGLRESRTARRVAGGLIAVGALSVVLPGLAVWALRR